MPEITLEHTDLLTNGVRLHAVLAGPPDGPLVILLHGFPEFWYGWRHQIEPLASAGYRVLVPDQRGYNLSDKPKGSAAYHVDELAKDVVGLIDACGREQAFIAGHDWGAAIAWHTAINHPERIAKMAILNVPHLDVMQRFIQGSRAQVRKSWYIFYFQLPFLPELALSQKDYRNMARMLIGSSKKGSFRREDLTLYKQAWSQPGALTGMLNWYRSAFRRAVMRSLPFRQSTAQPVHVPTLVLWGKNDVALSYEMAQPSLDLCDQGRLVFFEDATHWVQHDEAEAVTRHLLDFFR